VNRHFNISGYTPVGDLAVVSICVVMIVLIIFSYVRKTRSFRIFLGIIGLLILAANVDVGFYSILSADRPELHSLAGGMHCAFHGLLYLVFLCYVAYILEVTRLDRRRRRIYMALSLGIFAVGMALDALDAVNGVKLRVVGGSLEFQGRDVFMYGYLAFVGLIAVLMFQVRNRLYKRVMLGFYGTMAVSFIILVMQARFGQTSFTVLTFLYPVIAMFYILHSSPYDARLGTIDSRALEDMVRLNYENNIEFVFMSLYLRDFDEEGKTLPEEVQAVVRRFSVSFFKGATLFQPGKGHMILLYTKRRNPDYEKRIQRIMEAFDQEYRRLGYEYKIVIGESIGEISRKNEYVSFIHNVHRGMAPNTVYRVGEKDVEWFNRQEYILEQLEDIYVKGNLDDPRVLVYCQPVFNTRNGRFDTAEALMRLELEQTGMVYPDQFIPLAEQNGYIHMLTEIILHKTCKAVKALIGEGYILSRVSVNVSAIELKENAFCDDIIRIIHRSSLSGESIAIELTESRNESDFMLMRDKIAELKELGIKFYLDDFGTGYSNMERIMALPFDIIKFDRSLVTASGDSERSRQIVSGLANMFSDMNYSVLYEGVEKDSDEAMCRNMRATYLQGYKYSRPVPIEKLREYLDRGDAA